MRECAVCSKEMYDTGKGHDCIAAEISLIGDHIEVQRVKDIFGKTDFAICFCCYLKSLGVNTINEEQKND